MMHTVVESVSLRSISRETTAHFGILRARASHVLNKTSNHRDRNQISNKRTPRHATLERHRRWHWKQSFLKTCWIHVEHRLCRQWTYLGQKCYAVHPRDTHIHLIPSCNDSSHKETQKKWYGNICFHAVAKFNNLFKRSTTNKTIGKLLFWNFFVLWSLKQKIKMLFH